MPMGLATHAPTGMQFRMLPRFAVYDDPYNRVAPGEVVSVEDEPWVYLGRAALPDGTPDRRPAGFPGPGDANAPGLLEWGILAKEDALQAAEQQIVAQHGADQARAMLGRVAREVGERWIFRARLERGWKTGQRAT